MRAGFPFGKQSLIFLTVITAFAVFVGLAFSASPPPGTGSWQELAGTKLRAVLAPAPAGAPPGSWWNPINIIADYSGGTLDTKRSRLIIWGGGHAGYPGNEIYAIELLPTPKAVRLTNPSLYTLNTTDALADGNPSSRHTYASLVYLPEQDALWAHGGSLWRSGIFTRGTWMFRFDTGKWEKKADHPLEGSSGVAIADYDPVTKLVVVWGISFLSTYDPATNNWTKRGSGSGTNSERTGVIAASQRKMYVVGWTRGGTTPGLIRVIDLNTWTVSNVMTTGAIEITTKVAPGLDLDLETGELVAWAGGSDIYRLNLSTLVWTKTTVPGALPGPAPWAGTYGRFRYVPALKSFVGVSSIDQNAYRYNSTEAISITDDTIPPSVFITSPLSGATVSNTIVVAATASDNVGVSGIQFKLDGTALSLEDTTSPYSISWDTKTASNSAHTLTATARDAAGNHATSDQAAVTVNNIVVADTTPPKISNISVTITRSSATVTWLTDEHADSQVEYGTTISYGQPTALNTALVTSHTQTLTGLSANTSYNYRIKSKDASGNLAVSGNLIFTTAPAPSPNASLIPERTWIFLPYAPYAALNKYGTSKTLSRYDKHTSLATDGNGITYITGGDYYGASYRQETWALDIKARLANRADPTAGWSLAYPYCGPAGAPQPKAPDHVGWTWVPRLARFLMVPGELAAHGLGYELCPGETIGINDVDDDGTAQGGPVLLAQKHIMAFDPLLRKWERFDDMPGVDNGDGRASWWAVYDPQTDTILKAFVGGPKMGSYSLSTKKWQFYTPSGWPFSGGVWPKAHAAADIAGRRIFMVDADRGRLFKWDIDAKKMVDLGSVPPGGQINTDGTRGYAVWDSAAKALIVMHYDPAKGIYLYHPDETPARWEKTDFPTEGHAGPVHWRSATYDVVNNVIIALGVADGGASPGLWVLRLTDAPTSNVTENTTDTIAPEASITSPPNGATVSSTITVTASASDNIGVAGVQFKLDGTNLGAEDFSSPYSISFNTKTASNGARTLTATARDSTGNTKTSAPIEITVSNTNLTSNAGDINGDKTVDILDVVLIANYFGKTVFDSRADAAPPFGIIDIFDVMIVVINWGKQY